MAPEKTDWLSKWLCSKYGANTKKNGRQEKDVKQGLRKPRKKRSKTSFELMGFEDLSKNQGLGIDLFHQHSLPPTNTSTGPRKRHFDGESGW